jgi:penicillin amidase
MKKNMVPLLLLLITAAWLVLTTRHYYGLNSLQNIAAYKDGVLSAQLPAQPEQARIYATRTASVCIDTLEIPHIFGKDRNATAYALGYMHARDRYFQMELLAHTVMGELSEIVGAEGLNSDRNWKRFELQKKAKDLLDTVRTHQPELYQYLAAYSDGINAYVDAERPSDRDPLYLIWNYSPRAWKPEYSFLIQWYMSFDLTFYDDYVDRQELIDKLPNTVRTALYPDEVRDHPYIIPGTTPAAVPEKAAGGNSIVSLFRNGQPNNYAARPINKSLGSNNWVVGKTKTAQGQLFLCNDLHLFLTRPNIFYEVQLSAPGLHVYGYTIPGVPLVLTGHNDRIAWGLTNGGWDVTEQYLLKIDPQNPQRYWLDGRWEIMRTQHFPIRVKDGEQEDEAVDYTLFGPVVRKDNLVYALKWHPAQSCNALASFFNLMQAGSWTDFHNALQDYDYPSQNFAYADVNGNIGMICAGRMPLKPQHYAGGLLDGTHSPSWRYVPFDSLPQSYNPAPGYVFSANQEPQQGPHFFSSRWAEDLYRPERIGELLEQSSKLTVEDMRKMQLDVTDLSARQLAMLLHRYAEPATLSSNWRMMMNWDGTLAPHDHASIFYRLFRETAYYYGISLAGRLGVKATPSFDQLMNFLVEDGSFTFGGYNVLAADCFHDLMRETDSLSAIRNPASAGDAYHPYGFSIPHMTMLPGFDTYVDEVGGSENTINVNYTAHPVIRTIIEVKDGAIHSWMVNAIGQTGRLNDRQFSQQLSAWVGNVLHPTQFVRREADLKYIAHHIEFTPEKK